jgi:kinesin family protein 6/9
MLGKEALTNPLSQEEIYNQLAREIVSSTAEGYNGTIMCYGQTGAGKTFTMTGGTQNYKYRGIIPRAITHIFQEISSRFEQSVQMKVSYMEIYNDFVTNNSNSSLDG